MKNYPSPFMAVDISENNIEFLKEFDIFRDKVSLEIKLTAIAMYLLSSSFKDWTLLNVGKSAVHYLEKQRRSWVWKEREGKKACNKE